MKLTFLGVGEAFDPQQGNCSYLLESETNVLIDCGFAALPHLLNSNYDPNHIDAIYLTHFHADHTFGLPALLVRTILQEARQNPLKIISQPGLESYLPKLLSLAYPGIAEKVLPKLELFEADQTFELNELKFSFAESAHSLRNYSALISNDKSHLGISGDGALTEQTKALFEPCNALVHEAFKLNEQIQGHESGNVVAQFAATLSELKTLALVHIDRVERVSQQAEFSALSSVANCEVIIPEPGDTLQL